MYQSDKHEILIVIYIREKVWFVHFWRVVQIPDCVYIVELKQTKWSWEGKILVSLKHSLEFSFKVLCWNSVEYEWHNNFVKNILKIVVNKKKLGPL